MSLSLMPANSTLSFHGSWTFSGMGDDRKYTASNAGIKATTALRNMAGELDTSVFCGNQSRTDMNSDIPLETAAVSFLANLYL